MCLEGSTWQPSTLLVGVCRGTGERRFMGGNLTRLNEGENKLKQFLNETTLKKYARKPVSFKIKYKEMKYDLNREEHNVLKR